MNTFVQECEEAGIPVEPYRGRFYWVGPAARASTFEEACEVIRATSMALEWDSPLIYPRMSDEQWYDDNIEDYREDNDYDQD